MNELEYTLSECIYDIRSYQEKVTGNFVAEIKFYPYSHYFPYLEYLYYYQSLNLQDYLTKELGPPGPDTWSWEIALSGAFLITFAEESDAVLFMLLRLKGLVNKLKK